MRRSRAITLPRPRTGLTAAGLAVVMWSLAGIPAQLDAQTTRAPLVTDRPDQTESTAVVPVSSVQIEAGASYGQVYGGLPRLRALAVGGTLVRVGLLPWLEGRVGFGGWQRTEVTEAGVRDMIASGAGDVELQAKVRLREGGGASPSIALIPGLTLPTGEEDFGAPRAEPSLRLAVAHELSDRVGLGWNVAVARPTDVDATGREDTWSELAYTLALGIGVNERVGAFVESFGVVAAGDGAPPAHSLDGGFTFLLTPLVQLDVAAGVGISSAAEDWTLGVGLSVRLPR